MLLCSEPTAFHQFLSLLRRNFRVSLSLKLCSSPPRTPRSIAKILITLIVVIDLFLFSILSKRNMLGISRPSCLRTRCRAHRLLEDSAETSVTE